MNAQRFNWITQKQLELCQKLLLSKGKEYQAGDVDVMHNFKAAGRIRNTTPEKALLGMELKHYVSIMDIVDNIEKELPSIEKLEENFTEEINYLLLLKALILERYADS